VSQLKSKAKSLQSGFEAMCSIDEESGLLNLLFVADLTKKQHGELCVSRLKQPDVREFVRLGVDGGVQPVPFIVDPNHYLVESDLIRGAIVGWL